MKLTKAQLFINSFKGLIMRKAFEIFGQITLAVIVGSLLAVLFIEWMAGCGESYVDAKGITHSNECIIIQHNR